MKRLLILSAFLVMVSGASSAQTVCFNEVDTSTGPGLTRATILDSNGNGKLDLGLIARGINGFAFGIDSLLGNGDGAFSKVKAYHGPGFPTSLTTGDFNNDGKADLAIAFDITSNSTGAVAILLGNGDGTFGSVHSVKTALSVETLVAGDFNGDGKLDIAITTDQFNTAHADIELLLGNGDGSLQSPTVVTPLPWETLALSVADLNADGKLDLISYGYNTNGNGQVVNVLLGNGNGTFQTPVPYTGSLTTGQFAVADFNGDGKLDVAVPGTSAIAIFNGTGTGALTGPTSVLIPTSPLSLAAIDIFGDGRLSIVGSDGSGSSRIGIAVNNGNGTFTSQSFTVGGVNYELYAGDFNNDGKTDILILYNDLPKIGVLLNCS